MDLIGCLLNSRLYILQPQYCAFLLLLCPAVLLKKYMHNYERIGKQPCIFMPLFHRG
jgi:hypothetical protein